MQQRIDKLDTELKKKVAECEKFTDDLQKYEKLNKNLL